jgi:hypothetical protein
MRAMSTLASVRRTPNASITQVVAGVLVSLFAMLTVQMSALTAYVDVFGSPDGPGRSYDELGRRFTGVSQAWHQFGSLLWGVYAVALLIGVAWMWRLILTRPPRAAWAFIPAALAVSAVFWLLNLDRFYL